MFSDLKKKINSVIKDGITTNAQQISTINEVTNNKKLSTGENVVNSSLEIPSIPKYTFANSLSPVHLKPDIIPPYLNLNAGSSYLRQQEENWKDLHEQNERNSNAASQIDRHISIIQKMSTKTITDLSDLTVSQCSISGILQTLQVCGQLTKTLENNFRKVAESITELEDLCEQLKFQELRINSKYDINKYKEKKLAALDCARQQLVHTHANNVRQHENQITAVLKERQAVFQDAFQQDLSLYKQTGTIPKPIRSVNQELTLEEIVLDNREDTKELDNFLNKC